MPELVEKYFKEDLTEAEQTALEEALLNSDEAALQFEGMAKEAYLRYGLPEPQPKWGDTPPPSLPKSFHLKPWLWSIVLGGALALGWVYLHRPLVLSYIANHFQTHSQPVEASPSSETVAKPISHALKRHEIAKGSAQAVQSSAPKTTKPEPGNGQTQGQQVNPSTAGVTRSAPLVPKTGVVSDAPSLPARSVIPINADLNPTRSYTNLSVEVGLSALGYVTVRVVNNQGLEVVHLYQGALNPGHWVFEWDGKLPNGAALPPGFYQIEVRSGSYVQRKPIQIQ